MARAVFGHGDILVLVAPQSSDGGVGILSGTGTDHMFRQTTSLSFV